MAAKYKAKAACEEDLTEQIAELNEGGRDLPEVEFKWRAGSSPTNGDEWTCEVEEVETVVRVTRREVL